MSIAVPIALSLLLPATCIADLGPSPSSASPPRWHSLLPSIVVGVDHGIDVYARFQLDDYLDSSVDFRTVDGADHRAHDRDTTRWTISLQWQTGRSNTPSQPLANESHSRRLAACAELASLRSRRPTSLPEAIDHWAEKSHLQSLITSSETLEVSR